MKVHGAIRRGQGKGADEASVVVVEVDEVGAREPSGCCRSSVNGNVCQYPRGNLDPHGDTPRPLKSKPSGADDYPAEGIGHFCLITGVSPGEIASYVMRHAL